MSSESNFNSYVCNKCNTRFMTSIDNLNNTCAFCGDKNINKEDNISLDELYVLPFEENYREAVNGYKKKIKYNPLIPGIFRRKSTINKIRKIYLPVILYNIKEDGNISFIAADKITKIKNAPMQTFECGFSTNFDFVNLANCINTNISDVDFCTINDYNFDKLEKFREDSFGDVCYLLPNESIDDNLDKIKEKIKKYSLSILRENVGHDLRKVKDDHLKIKVESSKTVLVPIYLLNVHYKNKDYLYIRNGQTGKMIVDLIATITNTIIFSLVTFLVIFGIVVLLSFLL